MSAPVAIAVVLFALMPIFGPQGAFWITGFIALPYIVGRVVYERVDGSWWVLAAAPMPFVWFAVLYATVLVEIFLEQ